MFTINSWRLQLILYTTAILLSACMGQTANTVEPLSQGEFQSKYQFNGHPDYPSRLSLSTNLNDITYSAQISDFAGKVLTTVNNTTLQAMELVIPAGEKQYYVSLATQVVSFPHLTLPTI